LAALPAEVFTADDSLGWCYQFWQKKYRDEVNESGEKIAADELPAVTQLFTEDFMVKFLLHNTLGAWWAGKTLTAAELKILDPCCGSGHFLVAAFEVMVALRMREERLSARDACDAVLRDNLFGLEIDQRCRQIAAFPLALAAWKSPNLPSPSGRGAGGEGGAPSGYRPLPELHIACTGIAPQSFEEQWLKLAEQSTVSNTQAAASNPQR